MNRICLALFLLLALAGTSCRSSAAQQKASAGSAPPGPVPQDPPLRTRSVDAGPFTLNLPEGWRLEQGGACATLAFVAWDPADERNSLFFFTNIGPVYLSAQKRYMDHQYVQAGGYPVAWLDMPVVAPLTPENLLRNWPAITRTRIARTFMRHLPELENLQVLASQTAPHPLLGPGFSHQTLRLVFTVSGRPAQGLFSLATLPQPMAGLGFGIFLSGISAPHRAFSHLQPILSHCLETFTLKEDYVLACRRQQAQQFEAMLQAGRTLSETSDLIVRGWEQRSQASDILFERWSDTTLGRERLYDPDTGEVFDFDSGFAERYRQNPRAWNRTNLLPLPDGNHTLWSRAPLNGARHIHPGG